LVPVATPWQNFDAKWLVLEHSVRPFGLAKKLSLEIICRGDRLQLYQNLLTDPNGTDFRRVLVNLDRGLYRILY